MSKLKIAVEALKECASFNEGPEVTGGFDEPCAARISRQALIEIGDIVVTTDQRKTLLKEVGVAIALCDSPARKAEVALETVEKFYELTKKG